MDVFSGSRKFWHFEALFNNFLWVLHKTLKKISGQGGDYIRARQGGGLKLWPSGGE